MAVISPIFLTLADHASRTVNGHAADIANLLSQENAILDDMLFCEANSITSHTTVVRTGLPSATWRRLNYGVQPSKTTTAKVQAGMGMLEDYSQIDKSLASLNGDTAAFRLGEDMAHLESMNQTVSSTIFYGNVETQAETFNGFASYYSSLAAPSGKNIIDAGGLSTVNASIYLVCWGQRTCFGIYPKGSQAGLLMEDVTTPTPALDGNGGKYQALTTHFKWDLGLVVRDWRYVVRIANIDTQTLQGIGGVPVDLLALMTKACYQVPTLPRGVTPVQTATGSKDAGLDWGRPVFYCNRTIGLYLDIQAQNKVNLRLTQSEYDGMPILKFRNIAIKICDALLDTEGRVV